MESKIAIAHRSEIVRKGLVAMINPLWDSEIVQCIDVPCLLSRGYCETCRMLLFVESDQIESNLPFHENTSVIAVLDKNCPLKPFLNQFKTINLYSEFSLLRDFVDDFKKDRQPYKTEENELTQREKEVLRQVAMGFTNREIADSLFISIHTVITHRKNITGKLGIKSISGLTVYAIINRLIDPDLIDPEQLI